MRGVIFGRCDVTFCRECAGNVIFGRNFVKFGRDMLEKEKTAMLRIGICDDQAGARDALRFQLEKVMREETEQIVYEFSTGSGAVRWLKKHPGEIDLLFLDVEMPDVSGMEAAGQIREFDREISLVFVSGYTDYVFDGYRVNALDYVIKPAKKERIEEILKRVRELIGENRERFYCFKNGEGTYRLSLSQILCFYSDKRKVKVVCQREGPEAAYSFYGRLDQVEKELGGSFVRIHQRYLVNPKQVTYIGNGSVALDGFELPMSRAMREKASVKLARTVLGEG